MCECKWLSTSSLQSFHRPENSISLAPRFKIIENLIPNQPFDFGTRLVWWMCVRANFILNLYTSCITCIHISCSQWWFPACIYYDYNYYCYHSTLELECPILATPKPSRLQCRHFHYNGCVTLNPSFILCLWMTCVKNFRKTIDKSLCHWHTGHKHSYACEWCSSKRLFCFILLFDLIRHFRRLCQTLWFIDYEIWENVIPLVLKIVPFVLYQ